MSVGTYTGQDVADFVYKNGESKAIQIANKSEEIINIDHALSTDVLTGEYEVFVPDGKVTIGHWEGNPTTPAVSETAIQTVSNAGTAINPYNSNSKEIVRGSVKQAYNTYVENGQVKISSTPKTGSFGANAAYVLGEVNAAATAVSIGTSLGKVIGSNLYEANPDIWSGIDISQMDATWWDRIIADNPYNSFLMNAIFGIDVNGNAQAYVNEDAFAYMAQYMAQQGFFDSGGVVTPTYTNTGRYTINSLLSDGVTDLNGAADVLNGCLAKANAYLVSQGKTPFMLRPGYTELLNIIKNNANNLLIFSFQPGYSTNSGIFTLIVFNDSYDPIHAGDVANLDYSYSTTYYIYNCSTSSTFPGFVIIESSSLTGTTRKKPFVGEYVNTGSTPPSYDISTADARFSNPVEGVTDQDSATFPDVSSWDTPQDTLDSLKQQYPDLWNDALTYDVPDVDGNLQPQTWVPVPWPEIAPNTNPWLNTQPTTNPDLGTQAQTKVDLRTLPDTLTQPLTLTLTQPITDTPTPDVPQNPTDTGDGSSPTPVAPIGSASALWSVYHPTQAQINSFGGWLWSSDFIDQLLRVFQNPMDAVVSLRKVFATPIDAGQSTIHAGFLDSEVPSAYITQQYVFVDCGSVDCNEQFGNVFDYVSTNVSLYLPFIGIVPLNTSEVMRSTLHVRYGVDMFTGACLAMVEVIRDGNTVTMYQYSGNASVEYPLSGQRASSFLGGLMSLGGAALGVATGGGSLALAGMAVGGMTQMSSVNVSHSGGFSGNAGAMGIKKPYLIIERPQTKVAQTFPKIAGYPTNYSCKLGDCKNHVVVKHVHVEGINATENELTMIKNILMDGVVISD